MGRVCPVTSFIETNIRLNGMKIAHYQLIPIHDCYYRRVDNQNKKE